MADETCFRTATIAFDRRGPPLAEEPGLGALTLPGFLREVTTMYGEREALVFPAADGVTRWTYAELWERAIEVARALRACGVGKDGRVGVLMTNRPEWIVGGVRHLARRRRGRHAQHVLDAARARLSAAVLGRVGAAVRTRRVARRTSPPF